MIGDASGKPMTGATGYCPTAGAASGATGPTVDPPVRWDRDHSRRAARLVREQVKQDRREMWMHIGWAFVGSVIAACLIALAMS